MINKNIIDEKKQGITHDYSLKQIKKGLWFIKNKSKLKTLLIIILIVFNIILWSYNIFKTGHYLFVGMKAENLMVMELTNADNLNYKYMKLIAPHGFQYGEMQVFKNNNSKKYNIIIKIININPKHLGTFDYCLMNGEKKIKCSNDFILPGEKKYLFTTIDKNKYVPDMHFVVNSINWRKFDKKQIYDLEKFKKERLNFKFSNINFISGNDNKNISNKIKLSSLNFTAKNNTPFNYYLVPLQIFLYKNGKIVDTNRISIKNFKSQESQNINIVWKTPVNNITSVKIIPDINIFADKSSIMF